jgi:hypothetical protein
VLSTAALRRAVRLRSLLPCFAGFQPIYVGRSLIHRYNGNVTNTYQCTALLLPKGRTRTFSECAMTTHVLYFFLLPLAAWRSSGSRALLMGQWTGWAGPLESGLGDGDGESHAVSQSLTHCWVDGGVRIGPVAACVANWLTGHCRHSQPLLRPETPVTEHLWNRVRLTKFR